MAQLKQSKTTKSLVVVGGARYQNLFPILNLYTFPQVAKSGRRARLTADQSSFEESRYVRKSSTSASLGEVCEYVTMDS